MDLLSEGSFCLSNRNVAETAAHLAAAEEGGSNILFLAMGAALAGYGSLLINGLRTQLHQARKFGQYQLIRKLGEGGMGEVYLAEHQLLEAAVCLEADQDRSRRESDGPWPALSVRSGPPLALLIPIRSRYSIMATPKTATFYYVMEYLNGLSLAELVHKAGPLPAGRVIYLIRQVCAGLAEAHAMGLIHRDLKPANVFVAVRGGESDVAKVLDFGLVKVTQDPDAAVLTQEMTISGTPMFMAPEQSVADRTLDARADIYALGAVMYYALTGPRPIHGGEFVRHHDGSCTRPGDSSLPVVARHSSGS